MKGRVGLLVAASFVAFAPASHLSSANDNAPLAPKFQPDPRVPSMVVTLRPTAEWIDTRITVHRGERLFFTATGQIFWEARDRTTGPDGENGVPGWTVGPGGLRARVGSDGKPFEVGARIGLFPDKHPRPPHHPFPPPPLEMARDGILQMGFKAFVSGANTGLFEVTIRRAVPAGH